MKAFGKAPPTDFINTPIAFREREHYRTALIEAAEELEKLTVCDASHGLFVLTPFVKRLRISAGEVED